MIDPPGEFPDDWLNGWEACREQLLDEHAAAVERDANRPPENDAGMAIIVLGIGAVSGFIVGFVLALAVFA
jgi:hypothetical protein